MAQLRKCCNHPFLFPNAEAAMDTALGARGGAAAESIVTASGKMQIRDRMLKRLKAKGHRVVIFSQFTRMLDIVDDYLSLRGYGYCRLDGNTNRVQVNTFILFYFIQYYYDFYSTFLQNKYIFNVLCIQ